MTSSEIERILAEGRPIAAVLLRSRRWLHTPVMGLARVWPGEEVWRIDMQDASLETWHTFYCGSDEIVGISLERGWDGHQPTDTNDCVGSA